MSWSGPSHTPLSSPSEGEPLTERFGMLGTRAYPARQRRLAHIAGHMAGYGALLAFVWYQRQAASRSAA